MIKTSGLVESQFPSFYRAEHPNFIAFVRAYYEWLESPGAPLDSRVDLKTLMDVDKAPDAFIQYFKNTFMKNIPESIAVDDRLLMKHIRDLYSSKGTPRGYELLFRILFNKSIEIYNPGDYLFKPSDNTWVVPRHIEVVYDDRLSEVIGKRISDSKGKCSALVENVSKKVVSGRVIGILSVSKLRGDFARGQRLTCQDIYDKFNGPVILGSLIGIIVKDGGSDFTVGDSLDVSGYGESSKATVIQVSASSIDGQFSFNLLNGGSGYTMDPTIHVYPTAHLFIENPTGNISVGENITSTGGAVGEVTASNSSFLEVIGFDLNQFFDSGETINSSGGASATITRVVGGEGAGASFRVGAIDSPTQFFVDRTSSIADYYFAPLENSSSGFNVTVNAVSGSFSTGDLVYSAGNTVLLYVGGNVKFPVGEMLSNTSLGISGLTVFRSDPNFAWCSGSEAALNNANLKSGSVLVSSVSSVSGSLIGKATKSTTNSTGQVVTSNSTVLTLSSINGYFAYGHQINNLTATGSATVMSTSRLTDWQFPKNVAAGRLSNLDSLIQDSITFDLVLAGRISYIVPVNVGSGYLTIPVVRVTEKSIAELYIPDGNGGVVGNNAYVQPALVNLRSSIIGLDIMDSGLGFIDGELLELSRTGDNNPANGIAIVNSVGRSRGYWKNRNSFVSDVMKLQDSKYYQKFSYEIIVDMMLSSYENFMKQLVHPAGMALFGRWRLSRSVNTTPSMTFLSVKRRMEQNYQNSLDFSYSNNSIMYFVI